MSRATSPEEVAQKVLEVLVEENPDGSFVHPRGDVIDVLGLFFVGAGISPGELPEELAEGLGEFALKIGYVAGDSSEIVQQKLQAYFVVFPPNPEIMSRLRRALAEGLPEDVDLSAMPEQLRIALIRG